MKLKKSKIISIVTAAAVLLTSGIILSKTTSKASASDAVLLQYDSQWGSYPYGDGTISDSGCGEFAIINAVKYLTGNTMDIYTVADWASANEYIWGVGSSFSIAPDAAAKFGSEYGFQLDLHYGFKGYVGSSYPDSEETYDAAWDVIVSKLSQGEVAVGLVDNHFIALVDYDSSTDSVLVYDPGAGSKRQTTSAGNWKTHDELNYWSNAGTQYLKLRAYLTFYFATGSSGSSGAETQTTPAFSGSADAAGTYTVNTGGGELNLRAYPNTSSAVLNSIPNGADVEVIESDGSWASVTYNGLNGYCSAKYLERKLETTSSSECSEATTTAATTEEIISTTTETAAALSEENAGEYIVSADGSYLNMREGMGTEFDIVVQIPDETKVTVTAANDEWAAVTWDGNTGYCSYIYLKNAESSTADTSEYADGTSYSETETETVSTETDSSNKDSIESDENNNIQNIYSNINSIADESEEKSESSESNDAGAYRVKTDGLLLNLRAECDMDAEILEKIPDNSEVFVINAGDEWCTVSWKDTVGYCRTEYLEKVIIAADQSADDIENIDPAYRTLYGDSDNDGEVKMSDVILLHKALTGAISLNKTAAANSDCYTDGKLDIVDVTVIIQHLIRNCDMPINPAEF